MKITKEYEGITRKENGDYYISGSIETDEDIEIELDYRLEVEGSIVSEKSIISNAAIIARGNIEAYDATYDAIEQDYIEERDSQLDCWAEEITEREYLVGISELEDDDE